MSILSICGLVTACVVILAVLTVGLCMAAAETRDIHEDTGAYE
jgi:hypothetical protein